MTQEYRMRTATLDDADVITHHRVAMFRDMGILDETEVRAIEAATRAYLREALPAGEYLGWMVETRRQVVAGCGLFVRRMLPRPGCPGGGEEGYVLNVYTEPAHRRQGLARTLMAAVMAWCQDRAITRITLHASEFGRPLYETLGFLPTNEMRWESTP